jgi:hypothetical protein
MGGIKFRAFTAVSNVDVSEKHPLNCIPPPPPEQERKALHLGSYVQEDLPIESGDRSVGKHLHVCLEGQHYCLSTIPVLDPPGEKPHISCFPQGPCSEEVCHSDQEFSEETLSIRERRKLKEAADISPSLREWVDVIVEFLEK